MATLLAMALSGCAKPLPAERAAYAGEWTGTGVTLLITPEGTVEFHKQQGKLRKSIEAPLKEFQGDNFVVGVGFMSTTFIVSAPPHQEGDSWKMTVDGVELTQQPPGTIPRDGDDD